jgi:D-aminoacyl-tRNA deacylase
MENRSDEEISVMLKNAAEASGTELAYLHRKSMKGPQAQRLKALGESLGLQWVRSEDLEPLTGN